MMKIIKTIFITLILLFSMFRVGFCGGDDEVRVTIAALQQTYFNAVHF